MAQTIKRTSNKIYVGSDEDVLINIYLREESAYVLKETYNFSAASQSYIFHTIEEDGLYRVDTTPTGGSLTQTVLPLYPSLISNIAAEFKSFVCDDCADYLSDCGCGDMKQESIAALKYNNLASKIMTLESGVMPAYSDADRANYQDFIFNTLKTISCKTDSLLAKIIAEECLNGISKNTELYALSIIVRFWGIYLVEKNNSNNFENTPIVDVAEDSIIDIYDLYLYDDWYECLCNTCLRVDEATAIFDSGIDDTPDPVTNLPPLGGDLFYQIESTSSYFNYNLNQAIFNTVFSDDNDAFPTKVKIETIPSTFVLEDTGDVSVTAGQEINWGDIANYRINHTVTGYPRIIDSFTYRFIDSEGLESPAYKFNFSLFRVINNPPNVINGFSFGLISGGTSLVNKNSLFNVGSVTDAEGDDITEAKVVTLTSVTLELWNGSSWDALPIETVIDLSAFTDFGNFIRVTDTRVSSISDVQPAFTMAFRDSGGSNTWSNDSAIGNTMVIYATVLSTTKLTFTGGIATNVKKESNWIPVARIEHSDNYKNLTVENIVQTGYTSASLPYMLIPATDDTPWSTYTNSGTIVKAGTTNPTLNTYDIYMYTDVFSARDIAFEVHESGTKVLDVNTTFATNADTSVDEVATSDRQYYFMEFDETLIADFSYLDVPANWPADFIGTVPNPAIEIKEDVLLDGKLFAITSAGLIGIGISTVNEVSPTIFDSSGDDITAEFTRWYDSDKDLVLYISNNSFLASTIFLRLKY